MKRNYVKSGNILVDEKFKFNRTIKINNPMKGYLFFKNIEFYLEGEKARKQITYYWDNGWMLHQLKESVSGKLMEIEDSKRRLDISEAFLTAPVVQSVFGEVEKYFKMIDYLNNADPIEFSSIVADDDPFSEYTISDEELERMKASGLEIANEEDYEEIYVDVRLKGFDQITLEAAIVLDDNAEELFSTLKVHFEERISKRVGANYIPTWCVHSFPLNERKLHRALLEAVYAQA